MTDIDKERMSENLRTITQKSGDRARRIGKILRTAFAGMATELKEGATEVSPAAKELMSAVGENLKQTTQEASGKINDALKENDIDSQDVFSRVKTVVLTIASIIDEKVLPPVKTQLTKLDINLTERYGDRYEDIRDFLKELTTFTKPEDSKTNEDLAWRQETNMHAKAKDGVTWYEPAETQVEPGESSPFGQPPIETNGKLFTVETTASRPDAS